MRTLVDLPDDQIAALAEMGRRLKKSRTALIRESVAKLIADEQEREKHEALMATFGIWKDKVEDGVEYQRRLRAEWDEVDARIDERLGRKA